MSGLEQASGFLQRHVPVKWPAPEVVDEGVKKKIIALLMWNELFGWH